MQFDCRTACNHAIGLYHWVFFDCWTTRNRNRAIPWGFVWLLDGVQWRNQIAGLCVIVQCIWFLGFSLRSDEERNGKSKSSVARLNGRRPWRLCNTDCDSMDGNRPKAIAQRMPSGENKVGVTNHCLINLICILFLKLRFMKYLIGFFLPHLAPRSRWIVFQ